MHGLTEPTYTMWVRRSPVWDPSIDVGEFNLDKAQRLLSEAGHTNGFETKILANTSYAELPRFAQILQADLAKIGVRLTIEPIDGVQTNTFVTQGKFTSLVAHNYGSGDQDPALQFTAFVFRPTGNSSRFQSQQYEQMVEAARREPDWNKRIALYRQISAFVQDAAFVHPLVNTMNPFGLRSNVQGFNRQPTGGAPILEDIWLA
jgi:ABC-type transport system substrate-binding protein